MKKKTERKTNLPTQQIDDGPMLRPILAGGLLLVLGVQVLAAPAEEKDCIMPHTICVDGINECGMAGL